MKILRTKEDLRATLEPFWVGSDIGLVPTMGALHAGHQALFEAARAECDAVVASIFVNPAQFGAGEDFERYPRRQEADVRLAESAGVDFLFAPSAEDVYPAGFGTWVDVEGVSDRLEGSARPGHFRGVATVCLKLFNLVQPKRAYFGQKDAQQAAVLEQLVRDLDLEVEIRVLPTVREDDGLAASSRNAYLTPGEREAATALPRALLAGEDAFRAGRDPVEAAQTVLAKEPSLEPEYLELARFNGRLHLVAAVHAGRTRLIDNVLLEGALE
jgi:pantoate--beta-alanine ligase